MIPPHPVPAGFHASIFDMDGLLIDSEVLWHEAEIEILGDRLGVPLDKDGCRTTKGMFVHEVTEHWYGLYPWSDGPSPAEVAVTIVDRVIELILTKGRLKPGAVGAIDLCARAGMAARGRLVVGVPPDRSGARALRSA